MAEKQKKKDTPGQPGVAQEGNVPSEVRQIVQHAIENPILYAVGIVGVVLVVLVAVFYQLYEAAEDRDTMSAYYEALQEAEPGDRLAALEPLAEAQSRWTDEARYLYAETAVRDDKFDVAREAYNALLEQFPNSQYASSAAEGLAFLEERAGNLEAALQGYKDVEANYPGTFTARMQPFNRAQVLEQMERWEDAVTAYEEQVSTFPESQIANEAQQAIARIKQAHPALFPEEAAEGEEAADDAASDEAAGEEADTAEEAPAEEAPAEEAPAEEAPAEEAPAEEAPAEEAPAEETPAEETPAEETPAEEAP